MSDQPEAAAQKIIELACRGPLRLDDVIAEIAPLVKERDEILERLSECSKEMCLWNRKCEDARVERDEARAERDEAQAKVEKLQKERAEQNTIKDSIIALQALRAQVKTLKEELDASRVAMDEQAKLQNSSEMPVGSYWKLELDRDAAQARVVRLETALRRLIQQCDDTDWMGVAGEMDAALDTARDALSDPAPSGAPQEPRQLRPDELAVADPSRTVADIVETNRDRKE